MTNGLPESALPLTTAQRGLWVGEKVGADDAVMNIAEAVEIFGAIDPSLFRQALQQAAREMEPMRVRIVERDGKPQQSVRPTYPWEFPLLDVSAEADPRAAAFAWMRAELNRQSDLDRDPLSFSALLRIAGDRYFWYHRAHHVAYDGYTGGMAARRVAELYTAYAEGRAPAPCGFGTLAELVEAEAAYRDSERLRRDRAYWHEQLAGLPEAATLARRAARRIGSLRHSSGPLPIATANALAELGRRGLGGEACASLPQMLIGLVAAYYHRVTGADDLVFAMPVSGRVNPVLRRSPGMVANAVAIRLAFTPGMNALALFGQVSRVVRQALRHQQYRYEDLRRDLGLVGQGQQIARLGVNIEPFDYQLSFAGAPATSHNLSNGTQDDLIVFIFDRNNGSDLSVTFDANPALYSMEELDEHRRRLMRLIDGVLAAPERALEEIDILGEAERHRLLRQWNDTAVPGIDLDTSLPATIARHAAATPDAPAAVCGGTVLSYRELHERSVRQARRLLADGVLPGDIVAVALPRGEQLLIALLAIMRTGAAYLPLDLDAPAERIAMMLDDASPIALIAERETCERLARLDILMLTPEDDRGPRGGLADESLPEPDLALPEATAYVLYTSGSTGRPKGVQVSHRNLNNFLAGMRRVLEPRASDRFLALTTIIFDIAALELYLPLTVGARTVIAAAETARNPPLLARLIQDSGVTHLQATPSLWRVLLACPQARLDEVHALVGGEALAPDLAAKLKREAARVTQFYGPTETTVWSTAHELPDDAVQALGEGIPAPIGRPILNTRLYVLDAGGRPVPTGALGELYIGGAGVAKGYLHRAQLTGERFLPDRFAADGSRMYRTGDLVRWREDGLLEFVGRADGQVKIRGHRVELGEIEHQLLAHPAVGEAAVAAHHDADEGTSLAAYLVPKFGAGLDIEAVRAHLARHLPGHMIPSSFTPLDALPLTPNGKLDRKALPAPERVRRAAYVPPATEVEARLVALWQDIFGLERIGIHDNFFELGGDSLTAAEMIARSSAYFSRELPLASLFEAATIAQLAVHLQRARHEDDPLAAMLPLRAAGDGQATPERPLFCLHPVVGLSWSFSGLLRHLDDDLPLYGLQSHGLRGDAALPRSIEEIAAAYLAQMRQVQKRGPYRLLGWSMGGLIAHAVAARLEAEGERVDLLAMMDSYLFAAAAPADEAQEVRAALHFLGFHGHADASPPPHMEALADLLYREYGVHSHPLVQGLLKRNPNLLEHVTAVTRNNLTLARRYRPRRIDAGALFFRATDHQRREAFDGILQYSPNAWRPHVGGRFEVHEIDCHHQAMLDPVPAARIGRILRRRFNEQRLAAEAAAPAPAETPWREPIPAFG
ncbi:amino acid adenylation domain-containing protein [Luteimonas aquatica]|uniref:amino acid adenylation domain-containing protein n=1 Tax=Luteimonas aquatica TaxID=450364 RepID=UPI001F566256|nr:amino acid adenylation domain-containing protein [Luteimonas aquatica]